MHLWSVAALVSLVNVPFGYWRAHEPRFSRGWFLAVHLPVPAVVTLRVLSGLGFSLATFPVMIGAFFGGQFVGGKFYGMRKNRDDAAVSACLVRDLMRGRGSADGV